MLQGTLMTSQLFFYAVAFLISAFCLINYLKRKNKLRPLDLIPGPPGNFLFGHMPELLMTEEKDLLNTFGKFCEYGQNISKIWILSKPYVLVHKAESAEVVLSSRTHISKGELYEFVKPWLQEGLVTSTGSKWHLRRKMLTPTFHFKILEDFQEVFNKKSRELVSLLEKHENSDFFDVQKFITKCTLDIMFETALGLSVNIQQNSENDYTKALKIFSILVVRKALSKPILRIKLIYKLLGYQKIEDEAVKTMSDFIKSAIKERKENRALLKKDNHPSIEESESGKKRIAFLDLLLEKAEEEDSFLTDEAIREEVDTFVFAGHDTTETAISFTLHTLGNYPEIQRKVHEELDYIFGDSDRLSTVDDLKGMKYLECCIKETCRLLSPVPFIQRQTHEPLTLDGYEIPIGTTLHILIYKIHHDPKHFPEPEKFDPERFSPENSAGRHPYAFVPFSAGLRNCIGQRFAMQEIKVALSSIFRRFEVESKYHSSQLQVEPHFVLRTRKGLHIKLSPRNKK